MNADQIPGFPRGRAGTTRPTAPAAGGQSLDGLHHHQGPGYHDGQGRDATDETRAPSEAGIPARGSDPATIRRGGRRSASVRTCTRSDEADWPGWARRDLLAAVSLAGRVQRTGGGPNDVAAILYRGWYAPIIGRPVELAPSWRPLAGSYRRWHAAARDHRIASSRLGDTEVSVLDRYDAIGTDGWWRTWAADWVPGRPVSDLVRVHLSPSPDRLPQVVESLTRSLLHSDASWLLACTTDAERLRRAGAIVLSVAAAELDDLDLPALGRTVRPWLRIVTHPLCRPVAPGVALAEDHTADMRFGEHRCHLIALALACPRARRAPLAEIAEVFRSHGLDPSNPHRAAT